MGRARDDQFVADMERVLDTYKLPYDQARPVVYMDESPKQLMVIPNYENAFLETPWKLSKGKQTLFYLGLLEITTTTVRFDKIQRAYDYSYELPHNFVKFFFKPLKDKLDRYSNKSFNYSVNGEYIHIVTYYTKDVELELNTDTKNRQRITQRLNYWKNRHDLTRDHIKVIESIVNLDNSVFPLLERSYRHFIEQCKENKEKATDHQGDRFFKNFQNNIKEIYQRSIWGIKMPGGSL